MNIFDLDDPGNYICRILGYASDLPSLGIRVKKVGAPQDTQLYLVFVDVVYFDAPTRWVGADFSVAGSEEYWQLIDKNFVRPEGLAAKCDSFVPGILELPEEKEQTYDATVVRLYKARTIMGAHLEGQVRALTK
jgi:hypothetical protein